MYWQDHYQTPAHAVRTLQRVQRGQLRMTPSQLHIAHVAARSALNGISEDPNNLGAVYSLTELPHNLGGLKKDIKKALKSNDAAKISKVLAKEQAKLDKAPASKKAPARLAYVQKLQAQLTKTQSTPTTAVLPGAPEQPIPQLPDLSANTPASFASGSSGGSSPVPLASDAQAAEDSGLSMPIVIGLGAAALLVLYLLTRKH